MIYNEAPTHYRDHLILMSIDGTSMSAMVGRRRLEAATWPELKAQMDEELSRG